MTTYYVYRNSEWTPVFPPTIATAKPTFQATYSYDGNTAVLYRDQAGMVTYSGIFFNNSTIAGINANNMYECGSVPVGFRPEVIAYMPAISYQRTAASLSAYPDGRLMYTCGQSFTNLPKPAFFIIASGSWMIPK